MKEIINSDSKKWFVIIKGDDIHSYGELNVNQVLSVSDDCDIETFDTREAHVSRLTEKGIEQDATATTGSVESRQSIIDTLTEVAENSGLSVPLEAFYFKYRKEIINWVINGGEILADIFANDSEEWLDLRETEESLSPREFALNLLQP